MLLIAFVNISEKLPQPQGFQEAHFVGCVYPIQQLLLWYWHPPITEIVLRNELRSGGNCVRVGFYYFAARSWRYGKLHYKAEEAWVRIPSGREFSDFRTLLCFWWLIWAKLTWGWMGTAMSCIFLDLPLSLLYTKWYFFRQTVKLQMIFLWLILK